jgi:hypothetical protein
MTSNLANIERYPFPPSSTFRDPTAQDTTPDVLPPKRHANPDDAMTQKADGDIRK